MESKGRNGAIMGRETRRERTLGRGKGREERENSEE